MTEQIEADIKFADGWFWPAHEAHMVAWLKSPKNRYILNGRAAYQGRKQIAFLKLCKDRRVVGDVGAHAGLWSHNFAQEFETVHAFEPVALHRECFAKNVTADNVVMHPVALGAEPGRVTMYSEMGSSGNTQVRGANESDPILRPVGEVEMVTLDSFELPVLSGLKLDAEGFELNILRGGEETIKRCKPVIVVEQKRDMSLRFGLETKGAVTYLLGLGYKVADEISGDHFLVAA